MKIKRLNVTGMLVTGALVLLYGALSSVEALDNGLALTPPMGWNTFLQFGCDTDCDATSADCLGETQIKRTADLMVSEGYLGAGYKYLIIDGCWYNQHKQGRQDFRRFPNGMKALGEYIHKKGLKFGVLGGLEMEEFNSNVAASWDADYFKATGHDGDIGASYMKMSKQVNSTSRPMIVTCSWPYVERLAGVEPQYEKASKYCNTWRINHDVQKSWASVIDIIDWVGEHQDDFASLAGPGRWNDPDLLVIGNPELTVSQAQIQMALWSIMAAPLLMSVDLANVRPEYKEILLNREIIAINQDKLGQQGIRVYKSDLLEIWTRKISNGCYATAFVSLDDEEKTFNVSHDIMMVPSQKYVVKDLYNVEKEKLLEAKESLIVHISGIGVKFYKFIPY